MTSMSSKQKWDQISGAHLQAIPTGEPHVLANSPRYVEAGRYARYRALSVPV